MKAVCWYGTKDVRVENVPDPKILNPHDAIVRVTLTAICGSDLHLYDGYIPSMQKGDILGHEFMGEVVEVGSEVKSLQRGDRVVVPFPIACGHCYFCQHEEFALCDNSNPKPWITEKSYGYATAGIFGYSHMMGGYAGGQAEYVRVPFADVGPIKVPDHLTDEQVLFLTDILPTGYQAAEYCNIQGGDTVVVFGCGPVGQFAVKSAYLLGAERVIAIDSVPERLEMAHNLGGAETLNFQEDDHFIEQIKEMTGGRGPDSCIDAVGMEAHGMGMDDFYDKAKQNLLMQTDRPTALRYAIQACRKGGTVSIPGVYGGIVDSMPMGVAFGKGLTFKMGQTHVQRYLRPLLGRIENNEIDPSYIITHRMTLDTAPEGYKTFRDKKDNCIKIVMKPS
ncbi:MAG: zinc-dependent alcohol dehydrogenase [Caldilineaceae bacterium]